MISVANLFFLEEWYHCIFHYRLQLTFTVSLYAFVNCINVMLLRKAKHSLVENHSIFYFYCHRIEWCSVQCLLVATLVDLSFIVFLFPFWATGFFFCSRTKAPQSLVWFGGDGNKPFLRKWVFMC